MKNNVLVAFLFVLGGCTSAQVVVPKDVFVPVQLSPAYQAECPSQINSLQGVNPANLTDKQSARIQWETYSAWLECRKAIQDIYDSAAEQNATVNQANTPAKRSGILGNLLAPKPKSTTTQTTKPTSENSTAN